MRYLILGFALLIGACAQLLNGQQQPVVEKNFKEKSFFTTCSGSVETWGSCFEKAKNTCTKGYVILEKNENPTSARRDITFKCS